MTTLELQLDDDLQTFVSRQSEALGHASAAAYVESLLAIEKLRHRTNPLEFIGERKNWYVSPVRNLDEMDLQNPEHAPEEAGCYILMAASLDARFCYPLGTSPVFYIGQTINLKKRLKQHRQRKNLAYRKEQPYRAKHEYMAKFGVLYVHVCCLPGIQPKELEDELMARFVRFYGTLPVTNGAGALKRIRKIIDGLAVEAGALS